MSFTLIIAEKPDMGQKIAQFLSKQHGHPLQKQQGHCVVGPWKVSWAIGHLLEQAPPEAYDPAFEKWALDTLPIIPEPSSWKMLPIGSKKAQLMGLKTLIKEANSVIHAGDPGREGQLIVDEILDYFRNSKPVQRILLNALDPVSLKRAFGSLEDNAKLASLYQAGLGRQRADWLIGMNMTRLFTMLARQQGGNGVLSVGRVQTPTLNIVYERDKEIERFVPVPYALLSVKTEKDARSFWARWAPPGGLKEETVEDDEDGAEVLEEDAAVEGQWYNRSGHILNAQKAQELLAKIKSAQHLEVAAVDAKEVDELAPLPFELTGLQSYLNKTLGASADDILKACQKLYEDEYLSYPRTDCSYLPVSQHADAADIIVALSSVSGPIGAWASKANPSIQGRVFDDKEMAKSEHHAIIPTRQMPADTSGWSSLEKALYEAVVNRYLMQFYPHCKAKKTKITLSAAEETFISNGRVVVSPGWRVLSKKEVSASSNEKEAVELPHIEVGERLPLKEVKLDSKKTEPPARFTEGTLLQAMKHVHRYVKNPEERKILRSIEGIGRSATRAAIIKTLFTRQFLEKKGKYIQVSAVGASLLEALPQTLRDPGLTARWEHVLDAVAKGTMNLQEFEARQAKWIKQLTDQSKGQVFKMVERPAAASTKNASTSSSSKKPAAASGTAKSSGGASKPLAGDGKACPKCGKGTMKTRTVQKGPSQGKQFLGCSNYPQCNHSEWPK